MPIHYAETRCTVTERYDPHVYVFTGPCLATGKEYSVTVPAAELFAYRRGGMIQDTLVSVSCEDREFLMSGFSPEGWDATFGEPDDE